MVEDQKVLFVEAMLLVLQSHRYKKGEEFTENRDFSIVRDPMYKFSTEAKERFFGNLYLSLLFNYFVNKGAEEELFEKSNGKGSVYMTKLKQALM